MTTGFLLCPFLPAIAIAWVWVWGERVIGHPKQEQRLTSCLCKATLKDLGDDRLALLDNEVAPLAGYNLIVTLIAPA